MQDRDDILPIGGLNKDDDPRHFEKGDYLDARNLRIGLTQEQGDNGLIQNLKSTLESTIPDIAGTETSWTHLGVSGDSQNNRFYILIYVAISDSVDLFIILKHDISDDTSKVIFSAEASEWSITSTTKIYNPVVLNNNLIWTDNVNNIRMINVDRIETSTDNGITSGVYQYSFNYAYLTGYVIGEYIYFTDSIYLVLQNTVGQSFPASIDPSNNPTYYEYKCKILDCYLDVLDPNNFTLAALPSLIAPIPEYGLDSSRNINQLRGKVYQFSYRYIYIDWRKSTYSPPSTIAPPSQGETIEGEPNTDPAFNNRLLIDVNTGSKEVRSIEVIARDSGDPTTWYLIQDLAMFNNNGSRLYPSDTSIKILFYADVSTVVVDQSDVYDLFTYVPVKAKHIELIDENRLLLANISEGYDKILTSIRSSLSWENLGSISNQQITMDVSVISAPLPATDAELWQTRITLPRVNPGVATFYYKARIGDVYLTASFVYDGVSSYPSTVKDGLTADILTTFGVDSVSACITTNDYAICTFQDEVTKVVYDLYNAEKDPSSYYVINAFLLNEKYPILLAGSTHQWGQVYRDEVGRMSPIVGVSEMALHLPFFTESSLTNGSYLPVLDFELYHTPPDWAKSYEIVYAGNNSTEWVLYLFGYNYSNGKKDHTDPYDIGDSTGYVDGEIRVKIAQCQSNTRSKFNAWSVEEYVWEKGDRIRIMAIVDEDGTSTEMTSLWDTEVTGVFLDTDRTGISTDADETEEFWVYFKQNESDPLYIDTKQPFDVYYGTTPVSIKRHLYFELYRPKKKMDSTVYFTTGMTFPISTDANGFKYHSGDTDQVLTSTGANFSPAIIRNTSHDAWKYIRVFRNRENDTTFSLWTESQYSSDWYITGQLYSSGFPIPLIDSLKQNILTKRIRHSGILNSGTEINNISKFDFDDFLDLKDKAGSIEGLRLIGFTLKAIQQSKVTSIFINRRESYNAEGSSDYQFTDNVFGSTRPSLENWGTIHPESVIVNDRNLYYWDQSEGIIVRNSPNGQIAISNNKMKRYFTDLARSMDDEPTATQYVVFSYSKETDELFCLFGKNTELKDIITFSEQEGRWKTNIDLNFNNGLFYWIGKRLFHIYENKIYEWWKGTDYLTIGGDLVEADITFYANLNPTKLKTFDAIVVYQTGETPVFDSIEIPEKASAVSSLMKTYIYEANITEREGVYYCQILRDINDPRPGTESWKTTNGRRLRGLYAKIKMKIVSQNKVTLSNTIVLSTPSERSL